MRIRIIVGLYIVVCLLVYVNKPKTISKPQPVKIINNNSLIDQITASAKLSKSDA